MEYQLIELDHILIGYQSIDMEHSYQKEHAAAYELLSAMLAKYYKINLEECVVTKGAHGKPFFTNADIKFNVSHCRGMVACAISDQYEVGIDVENVRPMKHNVMERIFSEGEKQQLLCEEQQDEFFFKVWTFKESYVKMTGNGITKELSELDYLQADVDFYQTVIDEANGKYILSVSYCKNE